MHYFVTIQREVVGTHPQYSARAAAALCIQTNYRRVLGRRRALHLARGHVWAQLWHAQEQQFYQRSGFSLARVHFLLCVFIMLKLVGVFTNLYIY